MQILHFESCQSDSGPLSRIIELLEWAMFVQTFYANHLVMTHWQWGFPLESFQWTVLTLLIGWTDWIRTNWISEKSFHFLQDERFIWNAHHEGFDCFIQLCYSTRLFLLKIEIARTTWKVNFMRTWPKVRSQTKEILISFDRFFYQMIWFRSC